MPASLYALSVGRYLVNISSLKSLLAMSVAKAREGITLATIGMLFAMTAISADGQITNVSNDQSVPVLGAGHDYIGDLNEIVSPSNGSLSLRIQVPTPSGRGLSLPFQFSYNSNGIIQVFSAGSSVFVKSNLDSRFLEQGGWGYGLPLLSAHQIQVPGNNPRQPSGTCPIVTGFIFTDPSGSRHAMGLALPNFSTCNTTGVASGYFDDAYYQGGDGVYGASTTIGGTTTNDVQAMPFGVSDHSGTYYHFPYLSSLPGCNGYCNIPDYIEDRTGNTVTLSHGSTGFPLVVKDTAGRNLVSIPSFDSTADSVAIAGLSAPYVVHWESIPYNFSISSALVPGSLSSCRTLGSGTSGSMQVVSSIQLPNGQSYQFQYDSTYGLLNKIIYPTGAYVSYEWGQSQQPSDTITYPDAESTSYLYGCTLEYNAPVILHRYVSYDGVSIAQQQDFTYSTNIVGPANNWKTTVVTTSDKVRPGSPSFQTTYTYSSFNVGSPPDEFTLIANLVPLEKTVTTKDFSGAVLNTVSKTWQDPNTLLSKQTSLNGGPPSKIVYQYDSSFINVIQEDDYDYGQSTPTRTIKTQYQNYPGRAAAFPPPIINQPCQSITYNGAGTSVAETDYYYDGGTALCGAPGGQSVANVSGLPTGTFDVATFGAGQTVSRGNLTKRVQVSNVGASPMTTYSYDETGQVLSITDACGNSSCSDMAGASHTTTYAYADSPSGGNAAGNSNAYPTHITDALGHGKSFSYNYVTGQVASSTDENGQTTAYTHNDPFNRLTATNFPGGGQTTTIYDDSTPSVTTTTTATPNPSIVHVSVMDKKGHVIQTQLAPNTSNESIVDTTYDGMGKPYTVTNPYSSSPSPNSTSIYAYDALGRSKSVTHPDNSTQQWSYPGNLTIFTDEAGNQWTRTTDALGRLINVAEPGGTNTAYTYDGLDNLLSATQTGVSGETSRIRTFSYDSLSRLIAANNPENATQAYPPSLNCTPGGPWANCYSYDANGNLQTKTDNRNVITTYAYDSSNRLLSKSYTNAPAGSLSSCYQYDSSPAGIGRLAVEWTQAGTCPASLPATGYQTMKQILAYDPMGRVLQEKQCHLANCATGVTPYVTLSGFDLAGNQTSYTNGIQSITLKNTYDPAGRLSSLSSSVIDSLNPAALLTIGTYTPAGAIQNMTLGTGLNVTNFYDNRLRPTGETVTHP